MLRRFASFLVLHLAALLLSSCKGKAPDDFAEFCVKPLTSTAEIEQAKSDGYHVDMTRKCIAKKGFAHAEMRKRVTDAVQPSPDQQLQRESDAAMDSIRAMEKGALEAKRGREGR